MTATSLLLKAFGATRGSRAPEGSTGSDRLAPREVPYRGHPITADASRGGSTAPPGPPHRNGEALVVRSPDDRGATTGSGGGGGSSVCVSCACYCHCGQRCGRQAGPGGGPGDDDACGGGGGTSGSCCRGSPYGCPAVLEALRRSEHFPVLLLPGGSSHHHHQPHHSAARYGPPAPAPGSGPGLPLNDPHRPVSVDTDLFSGVVYLFLPGLPTTPPGLFEGRKRRFVLVIQGRFKRPVPADALLIGCRYRRPLRLGGGLAMGAVLSWVSRLMARGGGGGGGVELVLTGSDPRVRAPLAASANMINAARPGEQPHPLAAKENTRLMGPPLADSVGGHPWTTIQRRQYFRRAANRRAHVFDSEHVWTFHTWDQALGYGDCRIHAGLGASVDLVPYLGALPLQVLLEDCRTGAVAAHLDVCHWRQAAAEAKAAAAAAASVAP
ncbi:hypothetical protein PLESTF_001454700 [Pleodorina starrii]|nr:hypothetical protein PLESTM_000595000 [Pleodorina starrii]GLC74052.1 hypothetical protein PLESTF_001454700 [Pleodorina starrii]